MMPPCLRIGTRGSRLALVQTEYVARYLREHGVDVDIHVFKTVGDRLADVPVEQIPTRGVFVSVLERALLEGEIDLAVHSMKDLPGQDTPGLVIAAVPPREDPRDVLIGRTAPSVVALPPGARVGTSSLRRRAELLRLYPALQIVEMRGNVDTRVAKLDAQHYDAICLAAAGLHRLGLRERITQYFTPAEMIPAPGQGALALQTRQDRQDLVDRLAGLHDPVTYHATRIERAVLAAIGGGCATPVGVHAHPSTTGYAIVAARYSAEGHCLARLSWPQESGHPDAIAQRVVTSLINPCDGGGYQVLPSRSPRPTASRTHPPAKFT